MNKTKTPNGSSNDNYLKTKETLEQMLDAFSLSMIQEMLVAICQEKSEHLIENWQDAYSAELWKIASKRLEAVNLIV